jgi:hypothetical protein
MAAFKVDENLPAEVLDLLRGARHDASAVKDPPPLHPGIVVLRLARRDRWSLVAALRRALDQCSGEPLEARLCVVTDAGIRRRAR